MLSTWRKLSYYLQVKDLCFSHWKSEVMQEARTCYPRMSPSKVEHFVSEPSRQSLPYLLLRLVMLLITCSHLVLLSKRDCHARIRSRDLRSDNPAWSHGAIVASEGSSCFRDLVFMLIVEPIDV